MPVFDAHMLLAVFGVAVIGGIIGLDRTAAGQFMISQPIVAAPFMGWVLGDTAAGMVVGAALELIWVLDMPIGTFVPADATIGAVSATAVAAIGSPGGATLPVIGFSILLATALVPVTMKAESLVRAWNSALADRVLAVSGERRGRALTRAQSAGPDVFFSEIIRALCSVHPAGRWGSGALRTSSRRDPQGAVPVRQAAPRARGCARRAQAVGEGIRSVFFHRFCDSRFIRAGNPRTCARCAAADGGRRMAGGEIP